MNDLTVQQDSQQLVVFANASSFEVAQRMAGALSKSTMVPTTYQNNLPNCIIALEMAMRLGASPLMVMQNLIVIHGRPSWSSQFIIAAINTCGRYSPLRFDMVGTGDKQTCTAWVLEKGSGDRLEGPAVSIQMAKDEGWYGKNGSKWKTMPELMLRYRAASFFGRLYAPEMLMGIHSQEEIEDITEMPSKTVRANKIMDKFIEAAPEVIDQETGEIPLAVEEVAEVTPEPPSELLQEVYALLATVAEGRETTPDDLIDELTKGKLSVQTDLAEKAPAYLNDIKIMLVNL